MKIKPNGMTIENATVKDFIDLEYLLFTPTD